jgi:hypothetical protein
MSLKHPRSDTRLAPVAASDTALRGSTLDLSGRHFVDDDRDRCSKHVGFGERKFLFYIDGNLMF